MRNFNNQQFTVAVTGAGFAGTFTALELAKQGFKVILIDMGDEVIPRNCSSYNNCYKLHTGMHYLGDLETAKQCLINSVSFAKALPDFILQGPRYQELGGRGRHFVMSNSLFSKQSSLIVCSELQKLYRQLVSSDPANRVFGHPDNFIRFLQPADYPYLAKNICFTEEDGQQRMIHVDFAVETGESQVDFKRLRAHLQQQVTDNDNIQFLAGYCVEKIIRHPNGLDYNMMLRNGQDHQIKWVPVNGHINCAWQNAEKINKALGYHASASQIILREKISLLVELPAELADMNTFICSVGPHISVTNLMDGTAILTYEPVTNIACYQIDQSQTRELYNLRHQPEYQRSQDIANAIIGGCSRYVPQLAKVKLLEVRSGYVKMLTQDSISHSIYNKDDQIHRRLQEGGIIKNANGYYTYSGMKLTYTLQMAKDVATQLADDLHQRQDLQMVI